jgi:hypothetical protein
MSEEITIPQPTKSVTNVTDKLESAILKYQELRMALNDKLRVNGKTFGEWKKVFFGVRIPDDLDPISCRRLSVKILQLNQLASTYYTIASARLCSIKESTDWIYREKYQELVAGYTATQSKVPAAAFLETMAAGATEDAKALVLVADIEKNFWKDIINHLTRCRKQLENITMNNALDRKIGEHAGQQGGMISDDDPFSVQEDDEPTIFDTGETEEEDDDE